MVFSFSSKIEISLHSEAKGYSIIGLTMWKFGYFLAFLRRLLNRVPVFLNFLRISFAVESFNFNFLATLVNDYPCCITEVTKFSLFWIMRFVLLGKSGSIVFLFMFSVCFPYYIIIAMLLFKFVILSIRSSFFNNNNYDKSFNFLIKMKQTKSFQNTSNKIRVTPSLIFSWIRSIFWVMN